MIIYKTKRFVIDFCIIIDHGNKKISNINCLPWSYKWMWAGTGYNIDHCFNMPSEKTKEKKLTKQDKKDQTRLSFGLVNFGILEFYEIAQ